MRYVQLLVLAAFVAAVGFAGPASAASSLVTSSSDAGPGSFRAAIANASANANVNEIVFAGDVDVIHLATPVTYIGGQSLRIVGNGAILDGDGFRAETAGDLSVTGLTIQNAPAEGLTYELPSNATGTKRVSLVGVSLIGNGGHGALIDDQEDPEDTSNPNGSAASLDVSVQHSSFEDNGFSALDRDGLRVNEGGSGSMLVVIRNSEAKGNGADGIELDERSDGSVVFTVSGSRITENGSFDVTEEDLDDGMDVDESNAGDLSGRISTSVANDNYEEGWDFNESDAGDLRVTMANVEANRNREEGIDLEEDDGFEDTGVSGGSLVASLSYVTADGNLGGNAGLKLREYGLGDVSADVKHAQANGNSTSGILIREEDDGSLQARVERATARGNTGVGIRVREDATGNLSALVERPAADDNSADGIEFDENAAGDLTATASHGSASRNGGYGVRADEAADGSGSLALLRIVLDSNVSGSYVSNVPVTQIS